MTLTETAPFDTPIGEKFTSAVKAGPTILTTTTLANDPDLAINLAASSTYVGEAIVFYTATFNNKLKWVITMPSGAHIAGHVDGISSGVAAANSATSGQARTMTNFRTSTSGSAAGAVGGLSSADGSTTVTVIPLHIWFTITTGTAAGAITLQFAENATTDASGSVILSDSELHVTKVA